ncbi:MAG: class I SAM-dependent methyltransferase [Pirellulaceae bacterium]|nr:class I SAM-dependent methyltransferase [Pirellulaceae bacterium]
MTDDDAELSDPDVVRSADGSVGRFFDSLSEDYTAVIERCFPRYREMFWALLEYLPPDLEPQSILELGAGTGNLSALLADRFAESDICLVDLSAESLQDCRDRLGTHERFRHDQRDFRDLSYQDESFGLVASSISLHHLTGREKQALFAEIYRWLKPGGVFAYADQHAGETPDLYQRHIDHWKSISLGAGSSEQEWEMWMQHQRDHDHHDTMSDQMKWLSESGFAVVDCPWRYLLWTVLQARK